MPATGPTGLAGAYPATRLIKAQIGVESTWGSAATATAILHGVLAPTITPAVKNTAFDENRGSLVSGFLSSQIVNGGTINLPGTCFYEDLMYQLMMSLGTVNASGSSPYVWTFPGALTTAPSPVIGTLELGDTTSSNGVKISGCTAQTLSITGQQQGELKYTMALFGKTFTPNASLTSLTTYHTPEAVLFPSMAFYMDAAGGTPGTTAYAGGCYSFQLDITTGYTPIFAGGSKAPLGFTYAKQEWKLKLGLFNLTSPALRTSINTNLLGGLPVVCDLKFTSGTKVLEIQFAGRMDSDPAVFGDQQGAQAFEVQLVGQYDTGTLANQGQVILTNTQSALP